MTEKFGVVPEPRNTTDPSLDPSHLTPDGKRKHRRRTPSERRAQTVKFEQERDDAANDIIPQGKPEPGQNLKPKPRKIIGIDD